MGRPLYPIIFAGVILVWGCKSDNTEDSTPDTASMLVTDTVFLEVQVNNLRMRAEPNLTSETKMMLPEGAKVQYWNEHSEAKTEVTLRGQRVSDFWYLIKYGKQEGWVFGGALKKVEKKDAFDYLILPGERVGPVRASDTEQSIIDRIGGDLVERGEVAIGEGESVIANYIFPASENELILLWDQGDFRHLREIRIRKTDSPWKLANGVGIGSTLKEVSAANQGPFMMTGFEWDYAGSTLNWQGGELSESLALIFEAPSKIHKSLIGDQSIPSDEIHMARANPKVKVMRVLF